jgi:hypothetical protein
MTNAPLKSYRKIDYRLRPAKSIERKMLAEAFRKLSEFGRVDKYTYVGLGSVYFSDLILFHRALGFRRMVSIEDEDDTIIQDRFLFNVPFSRKSLELRFGSAGNEMAQMSWDVRSIVWLDYDRKLSSDKLSDIAFVCSKAVSGSVIIVSVNASSASTDEELTEEGKPIEKFKSAMGAGRVPAGTTSKSLSGWGTAQVCRTIIQNEIEEALKQRNGILPPGGKMRYQQLFNFRYSDGAKMLTVGGVLYDEGQEHILKKCAFDQLDFYRPGEDAHNIRAPLLTFKELRALDAHLPSDFDGCTVPVPAEDIEKYAEVYRYFPYFVESEF